MFWHSLGHAGNGSFLDVAVPRSRGRGCATYAIDGPGLRRLRRARQPDDYAIDHLAGLLWDVVDALDLTRPVVLSGHSWGGADRDRRRRRAASGRRRSRPVRQRAPRLRRRARREPGRDDRRADRGARGRSAAAPRGTSWWRCSPSTASTRSGRSPPGGKGSTSGRTAGSARIASNVALAASRQGLMRGRASAAWPAVAAAAIPTLVLLATEPAEQRDSNAEAGERMQRGRSTGRRAADRGDAARRVRRSRRLRRHARGRLAARAAHRRHRLSLTPGTIA